MGIGRGQEAKGWAAKVTGVLEWLGLFLLDLFLLRLQYLRFGFLMCNTAKFRTP